MDRPPATFEHAPLKGETRIVEPGRAERSIARRSAETRATVPHLELGREVEVTAALELARGRGAGWEALLVCVCAQALRAHPRANGAYRDGRWELYSRVNIAIVVHRDDDQLAPTVLDADTKSLEQLERELAALRERARSGALAPPELAGATFTLTDASDLGADRWAPLINPPQAAALAAGAIREEPVARADQAEAGRRGVVPGHRVSLTLACDHRILYGARAAAFLAEVAERLEAPGLARAQPASR